MTSEGESRLFVRRSLARAQHESGGDDSPHSVESFPRMAAFAEEIGCKPAMQFGELPHSFATRFASKIGVTEDCTQIVHSQREIKSSWELEMMAEGAEIQMAMFEAVSAVGGEGVPEIELSQPQKRSAEQLDSVVTCKCVGSHFSVTVELLYLDEQVVYPHSLIQQLVAQALTQWPQWEVGLQKSKQTNQSLLT